MPWCPKCKCEYRKGIALCADCGVELVESLEGATALLDVLLLTAEPENEALAIRFEKFLQYSEVPAKLIRNQEGQFEVYTSQAKFQDAKRCFQAFYAGESERAVNEALLRSQMQSEKEEEEEADENAPSSCRALPASKEFKSAVARYEDYHSSAYAFSLIGVLGVGFALLNILNILPWFNLFTSLVMLVMFGIFLGFGIVSFSKLSELKVAADKETELVVSAKDWLKNNVTEKTIGSYRLTLKQEAARELEINENTLDDISYLHCLELIRTDLLRAVPELDETYAEQLVDEYYNDTFTD